MSAEVDEQEFRVAPGSTSGPEAAPASDTDSSDGPGGRRGAPTVGDRGAPLGTDWAWVCDPSDRELPREDERDWVDHLAPFIRATFLARLTG